MSVPVVVTYGMLRGGDKASTPLLLNWFMKALVLFLFVHPLFAVVSIFFAWTRLYLCLCICGAFVTQISVSVCCLKCMWLEKHDPIRFFYTLPRHLQKL